MNTARALLVTTAAAAVVLIAGPAAADDDGAGSVPLTPTLNCIASSDQVIDAGFGSLVTGATRGDSWAVLGYVNPTDGTVTVPPGNNKLSGVQGQVPSTFAPGTQYGQGVAALPPGASGAWTLTGTRLPISATAARPCQDDQLPATGNGLGSVLGLLASIPVGFAAAWYAGRRRRAR